MSASNVYNEKSSNLSNIDFPGYPTLPPPSYPTLPPPYSPEPPSVPIVPTAPPPEVIIPGAAKTSDDNNDENIIKPIEYIPKSMKLTCPSCKAKVMTRTETHPTLRTHACACLLFWIVWWPCICLPYCMPGCNNVDHFCPNCDSYIGGYKC